jgi:hypothetical protein
MKVLDFHRSFLTFEADFERHPPKTISDLRQTPHNRARVRIECRCEITDPHGNSTEYFLGEATKSERVGASRELGIFTQPNADYRPVLSHEYALLLKSWDQNNKGVMLDPPSLGPQPERNILKTSEAFYRYYFELQQVEGLLLKDISDIIRVADGGKPLVARTEYQISGHRIVLDYPIWTMNVSERYLTYQTDTGPVLYPDFKKPGERLIERFWLAFSAFNAPNWIEFIVQKPTPVGNGISVNHYSEVVWIDDCLNSVIATD